MSQLDSLQNLRDRLEAKLKRLEELEENIRSLFPKEINARSSFVFEQRLKAATELYRLQLAYLQEIARLSEKLEQTGESENEILIHEVRKHIRDILKRQISEVQ